MDGRLIVGAAAVMDEAVARTGEFRAMPAHSCTITFTLSSAFVRFSVRVRPPPFTFGSTYAPLKVLPPPASALTTAVVGQVFPISSISEETVLPCVRSRKTTTQFPAPHVLGMGKV